jgi:hypothetical protein
MTDGAARKILVVANETVTGRALIDAVKARTAAGPIAVHVICPQNQPSHGYVVYDETVRAAAENRLAMTLAQLREIGVEASGEVMDPDPYSATMDAVGERDYDEIVISTHPDTRSGWLRQDLVTRVAQATRRPVEHVVVDFGPTDTGEETRTLVVANQTVAGQALIDKLEQLAAEGPHRFIVVVPQGGAGEQEAHRRLAHTLERLNEQGVEAIGQVTHPDPYTAVQQGLRFYGVDEVVISTFPETRSGWLRADLVGRVEASTDKPVHHVVASDPPEEARV